MTGCQFGTKLVMINASWMHKKGTRMSEQQAVVLTGLQITTYNDLNTFHNCHFLTPCNSCVLTFSQVKK